MAEKGGGGGGGCVCRRVLFSKKKKKSVSADVTGHYYFLYRGVTPQGTEESEGLRYIYIPVLDTFPRRVLGSRRRSKKSRWMDGVRRGKARGTWYNDCQGVGSVSCGVLFFFPLAAPDLRTGIGICRRGLSEMYVSLPPPSCRCCWLLMRRWVGQGGCNK